MIVWKRTVLIRSRSILPITFFLKKGWMCVGNRGKKGTHWRDREVLSPRILWARIDSWSPKKNWSSGHMFEWSLCWIAYEARIGSDWSGSEMSLPSMSHLEWFCGLFACEELERILVAFVSVFLLHASCVDVLWMYHFDALARMPCGCRAVRFEPVAC